MTVTTNQSVTGARTDLTPLEATKAVRTAATYLEAHTTDCDHCSGRLLVHHVDHCACCARSDNAPRCGYAAALAGRCPDGRDLEKKLDLAEEAQYWADAL